MGDLTELVKRLIVNNTEEEWYEFKDSWFDPVGLAEYISSMSNVAALMGKENLNSLIFLEMDYLQWRMWNLIHKN